MKSNNFYITTPIYYPSGNPHMGHAYSSILADVFARYQRSLGNDVLYVCGSDEHGVPITITAKKHNVTPQNVIDKYHGIIKQSFLDFGISFDFYGRTSDKLHHSVSSNFFKALHDRGEFVQKESEQYYDEKESTFLADRYIQGTCPICDFLKFIILKKIN